MLLYLKVSALAFYGKDEMLAVLCDEYGCLEIGRHNIVLLVGIEQYGAVVDEIADERGGEQREEGEIDDAQLEDGVLEHEGEEGTDDDACRQHKTANITVKATEDRDYPADFFPVALGNGLIECIAHRAPTPNSAKLRNPRMFCRVPVNPMKSAPRWSRNILREKNDSRRDSR